MLSLFYCTLNQRNIRLITRSSKAKDHTGPFKRNEAFCEFHSFWVINIVWQINGITFMSVPAKVLGASLMCLFYYFS